MEKLEALRSQLPEAAKDVKLNARTVSLVAFAVVAFDGVVVSVVIVAPAAPGGES